MLQANLDMQSGMLHAEDKDFQTAFSYFIEALDGYNMQEEADRARTALQYMLLCKIMLNLVDDVNQLMSSKQAVKYAGQNLEAMKAIARAHGQPLARGVRGRPVGVPLRARLGPVCAQPPAAACTTPCSSRTSSR